LAASSKYLSFADLDDDLDNDDLDGLEERDRNFDEDNFAFLYKVKVLCRKIKVLSSKPNEVTSDPSILNIVRGYQIPFSDLHRQRSRITENLVQDKEALVEEEVQSMLLKAAVKVVPHVKSEFLSRGHRPVINLKKLNSFVPIDLFAFLASTSKLHVLETRHL